MKAELALLRAHLPEGVRLSRLHWGGGTPTYLPATLARELVDDIRATMPFTEDAEFSVELDPLEIDAERLDALIAAGMNTAFIGMQDFAPQIQEVIGRKQGFELTSALAETLRGHGVKHLLVDVLFGLPLQTHTSIALSVQKLLTLSPDRVALHTYAHMPWMSGRQNLIPPETIPSPIERLSLFETARKLFLWNNYTEIGIDHFVRPGDKLIEAQKNGGLRRNFQGYTDDPNSVLIGLGASSISRFPQGFAQNDSATSSYIKTIRSGRFATYRGHIHRGEDRLRARIIEQLMCKFRVNRAEILRDFDVAPERLSNIFTFVAGQFGEMLRHDKDGFFIPPRARPLTRLIARSFDAYDRIRGPYSGSF